MMTFKHILLATAATAIMASPAFAQDAPAQEAAAEEDTGGLEEIVVTAQKREERLQDVPVSVTALTEARWQTSVSPILAI